MHMASGAKAAQLTQAARTDGIQAGVLAILLSKRTHGKLDDIDLPSCQGGLDELEVPGKGIPWMLQ